MPLMDQRSVQTTETHLEAVRAITALAHLLGRQAARELDEQVDPFPTLNTDEGVGNDQP